MAATKSRIMMGANLPPTKVVRIPTGWYLLDSLVLDGGIRTGIMAEVASPEGGGKTLFCMRIAANAQRMGLRVAWGDPEYYVKPGVQNWFTRQGVDFNSLQLFGHEAEGHVAGEDVLSDALAFLRATEKDPYEGEYWADVVVIDSLAALKPRVFVEGLTNGKDMSELNKDYPGMQARLIGTGAHALMEAAVQTNKLVLVCNQARSSFGKLAWGRDPESNWTPYGGREWRHRVDLRLRLQRVGLIKERDEIVGQKSRIEVSKNRVGQNYQKTGGMVPNLPIYFDGRDYGSRDEVVDAAIELKIITQKGAWFEFNGHRAQGKKKILALIKEHGLLNTLDRMVMAKATGNTPMGAEEDSWAEVPASEYDVSEFFEELENGKNKTIVEEGAIL